MRILSGIQPTGVPHLGNYFGMMRPAIALQEKGEAFYFIADLHALTTLRDPKLLQHYVQELALDFLAVGLDPQKACFFRQSDIAAIPELTWILSCVAPMGLLERCHSYKDKVAKGLAASVGLFAYPILMAADILAYQSDLVPVGKDQKQHLEVTRDLAIKINEAYPAAAKEEPLLKLPEPFISEETALVPGTDGTKMSKSYGNTIELFMEEKSFRKKIMGLQTDSTPVEAPKPTENSTILGLYQHVASVEEYRTMKERFERGGEGYGNFKKELFERLWEYLRPMRERRKVLSQDLGYVEKVLSDGAQKASAVADATLSRLKEAVGVAGRRR